MWLWLSHAALIYRLIWCHIHLVHWVRLVLLWCEFTNHFINLLRVWRFEIAGACADGGQLMLLRRMRSNIIRLMHVWLRVQPINACIAVSSGHVKNYGSIVVQVNLLVDLLTQVTDLEGLLRWLGRKLRILKSVILHLLLSLDHRQMLHILLKLLFLCLLFHLGNDIRSFLRQPPYEIIITS